MYGTGPTRGLPSSEGYEQLVPNTDVDTKLGRRDVLMTVEGVTSTPKGKSLVSLAPS